MDKTIFQIIHDEDISTLYQPIVNLITGETMGYEALSRGPEWSQFFSPLALIEEADRHGLNYEIEYLFRKKAINNVQGLKSNQRLFINVNPKILKLDRIQKGETRRMLVKKGMNPTNIVLELTERSMISDYNAFNDILNYYKEQDYKIAIDDVGAGYSGLRTIRETQPHFIKIDMELIRNIDQDTIKEAMIKAFLNFSITTNIRIIAEGIETENELTKLIEMGVHYGQGYFLQRPQKKLNNIRSDVIDLIKSKNTSAKDMHLFKDAKDMIGPLVNPTSFALSHISCDDIKKKFDYNDFEGLTIIDDKNKPLGIVMRENLLSILSSRYGLSLYTKKKISHIMDIDFLMVDYHTTISEVSTKAMSRDKSKLYDIIVVTRQGEYYGTLSINSLLQHLITHETQIAKELNPLTRLPGNIIINRVLNDIILYNPSCATVYLDFDSFKPYNDIYGFESGDQFIKRVSEIIVRTIKNELPYNSFIGHIGGDDFIFILETSKEKALEICQEIIDKFEASKARFFSKEDFEKGYITAFDRDGIMRNHSLTTLSISGIYNNLDRFKTVEELSKHMTTLKKEAKSIEGNAIVIT